MESKRLDAVAGPVFICAVVANIVVLGSTALADHPPSDWYEFKWREGTKTVTKSDGTTNTITMDKSVDWDFVDNFPQGNARDSVRAAAYEWSKQNATMKFNFLEPHDDWSELSWNDNCPTPRSQYGYQRDKVGWAVIGAAGYQESTDALAITDYCTFGADGTNTLYSFRIKVNKDAPWFYSGGNAEDNPPDGKFDLESAIAHEFGHATGRSRGGDGSGHFLEGWAVCPDKYDTDEALRHTMCPGVQDGRKSMRSLEEHDRSTFNQAYP